MATTTPNYGWAVPTSTDLVKDGATAIETLGDAIDASLVDLRGGTTGQVLKKASATQMDFEWGSAGGLILINTTSMSAVASQSFNDVFSTTYDNYRILLNVTATGAADLSLRMRVSGADDTSANYQRQKLEVDSTTVSGSKSTGQTSSRFVEINTSDANSLTVIEVMSPFLARPTMYLSSNSQRSGTTHFMSFLSGAHNVSSSYTGFTIIPNTSTVTGTVSVYGYAK